MVDLSNIRYRVTVMDETGNQHDIKDYIQNLGWEENENEISVRSSFTARNDKTSKGYLSSLIKPGCLVGIFASDGTGTIDEEVARGYVETWNPVEKNGGDNLKCTCYDELYKLQKSQDNRYYPSGTGTKSAILGIFADWGIPNGGYEGPNVTHGKTVYNNQYLADIILGFLDDAAKKGCEKCMVRADKGSARVAPRGANKEVYVFEADNTQAVSHSVSTADLITRVKVIGRADGDGRRSVEATLNGLTEYGIRQRIYIRGSDESLADAKSAAQEILDGDGRIAREMTVQSPDVPCIRKWDLVYVKSGSGSGYFYVKNIKHDADVGSMTMGLEYAELGQLGGGGMDGGGYKVGDIVDFHGGTHYLSSYPGAKGWLAKAGKAKITKKDGAGKAHPWHLVHTDSGSNVYGWVDDGTFE